MSTLRWDMYPYCIKVAQLVVHDQDDARDVALSVIEEVANRADDKKVDMTSPAAWRLLTLWRAKNFAARQRVSSHLSDVDVDTLESSAPTPEDVFALAQMWSQGIARIGEDGMQFLELCAVEGVKHAATVVGCTEAAAHKRRERLRTLLRGE